MSPSVASTSNYLNVGSMAQAPIYVEEQLATNSMTFQEAPNPAAA